MLTGHGGTGDETAVRRGRRHGRRSAALHSATSGCVRIALAFSREARDRGSSRGRSLRVGFRLLPAACPSFPLPLVRLCRTRRFIEEASYVLHPADGLVDGILVRDSARQRGGGEIEGGGWGQRAIPARRLLLADKARDAAIKVRNSPFHAVKKTVRARTRIKSNIIRHKNIPCARARAQTECPGPVRRLNEAKRIKSALYYNEL